MNSSMDRCLKMDNKMNMRNRVSMAQNAGNMPLSPMDIADMILGFQRTQILYSACSLGIFEELGSSTHAVSAINIANKLATNADATERLMNACVGLRLLEKEVDQSGIALYRNSPATQRFLVRSSPMSMRPLLTNMGFLYPVWEHLSDGVKEGKCQMSKSMNSNFFEGGYYETDSRKLDFLQAMHMFSSIDAPMVLKTFDLSEFSSACDLGGGTGAMAVQLAKLHPNMLVTVLDLEHVVNVAPRFMPKDKPDNMVLKSGDFFKDSLPPADLYILCHVIHDWGEEKVKELLKKVYKSLKPGGALLILEKLLTEQKDGPMDTLLFDIGMVICSEGRERSSTEYSALLQSTGFSNVQIKVVSQTKWHDAILARKPEVVDGASSD